MALIDQDRGQTTPPRTGGGGQAPFKWRGASDIPGQWAPDKNDYTNSIRTKFPTGEGGWNDSRGRWTVKFPVGDAAAPDVVTDKIDRGPFEDGFDWSSLFAPGGGGGSGGGGGGISAGHVTAGHATAGHGTASLIDTTDPIYSLFAPKPWMSGMLAKGQEYTSAATEDNLRLGRDAAARSGVDTSSPAYQYMVAMQRRDQQKALANALRDANLAWTLPAADRRHGALGQNASMLTSTSNQNAGNDTQASIANAGYATQASAANAGNQLSASQAGASNALGYAQLGQQGWQFQTNFVYQAYQDMIRNLQYTASAQGGSPVPEPDYLGAAINGSTLLI